MRRTEERLGACDCAFGHSRVRWRGDTHARGHGALEIGNLEAIARITVVFTARRRPCVYVQYALNLF